MRQNIKTKPHSPRYEAAAATVDKSLTYDIDRAITLVKGSATAPKLKESVDLSLRLGIDPKKNDQNVRGITTLPHGTGKKRKVAVLAKGQGAADAEAAGADEVRGFRCDSRHRRDGAANRQNRSRSWPEDPQ